MLYSALWAIEVPHSVETGYEAENLQKKYSTVLDTIPKVPIPQLDENPLDGQKHTSPFQLETPASLLPDIEYNPETNEYDVKSQIGGAPASMTIDEYNTSQLKQEMQDYWRVRSGSALSGGRGNSLIPQIKVPGEIFDKIFGSNIIDIRPSGSAELRFGFKYVYNDNPTIPVKQRRVPSFLFEQDIKLDVLAKIGDKIQFNLNYNTEANFDFENKMKLKYEGKEDEIIQLMEFGDVTMPLSSTLIQGSQTLFGFKTQLKFGKLNITSVISEQRGESQTITVSGGAQTNDFYFKADEYEENRHYFLGQFYRENYNRYLSTLPLVNSPIVITKIEVWKTNIGAATTDNRNIIAFTDLAEQNPSNKKFTYVGGYYPYDSINNLTYLIDTSNIRSIGTVSNYLQGQNLVSGKDFEKIESARLLTSSEYTFNAKLGFISLNSSLNSDQVLAVAYQYTVIGDPHVYQVGEFSNEVSAPNCIRVKLLKSSNINTSSSLWKLMMKNVYSLKAYQVEREDFRLNILYTGEAQGIPNGFYNEGQNKGIPLIRLLGLDRLNQQQDPYPDGVFDFLDNAATQGGLIQSNTGRIYFPYVEPFGSDLRTILKDEPKLADKYAFDSLYTCTKQIAQQFPEKNKYYLEGVYKSNSGSEIYLNAMNIPDGSVKVTAGGIPLTENVDYTVNYSMGRVTIINESILNSGQVINVSLENQSGLGQKKTFFGLHLDYAFNKNFNLGATIVNLSERPYTEKVNYGDEPINNTIWGMNMSYKKNTRFLTKMLNWLPFYSSSTESSIQFDGEFAHYIPGHSRAIGKTGVTYIDDFEATKSTIDLKSTSSWSLASTPQGQTQGGMFPEAIHTTVNDAARRQLALGYNRAILAWYVIDPLFYRNNSATPSNITKEDQSKPYAREVYEQELFPNRENANNISTNISVFNMSFFPSERGPYNYDVTGSEGFSQGVNVDGTLKSPETRWGGIMRKIDNTDFSSSNIEYIEFWMMDPFIENPNHTGGKLYFNLGDISEDVLRDGQKSFENGLPGDGSDENTNFTVWGRVPTIQSVVNAFDNDARARVNQDVGYDGLADEREKEYFKLNYLDHFSTNAELSNSEAYNKALSDPSSDDYYFYRSTVYDKNDVKIIERYKYYNNSEGNSPLSGSESYPTTGSNIPDNEDVNNDNTLNEDERYYQYVVDLHPDKMKVGQNHINDIYEAYPSQTLPNGTRPMTKWYQFKIPIKEPSKIVGSIDGYNSIRYLRVFMKEFAEPIYVRLATFELVRNDWRKYDQSLLEHGDYMPGSGTTSFNVSSLSIEENGSRVPINYVLPPGVERQQGVGGTQIYYVDEQSLTLKATDLIDGDARAVYKNTTFDMRRYKRLKMFIHGEKVNDLDILKDGDVTVFIRLGSDFNENYYEYEVPLKLTTWGAITDTDIWPESNEINLELSAFTDAKTERNREIRDGSTSNLDIYTMQDGNNMIRLVGEPNLGDVRTIMIGVRNPKKRTLTDDDDMLSKNVEVWVDELRLSDFDESSSVAALGRLRINLADLGDMTLAGSYSSAGFGTIEQSITERQQESVATIDFATNLEAGKVLFPEKWNIKIPLHYDISTNVSNPEYNPLNPDVKLKDDLRNLYETKAERDSVKKMVQDFVLRQNVNLMNIRKERNSEKNKKNHFWDVENIDLSYSYSEVKKRNVDYEFDNNYTHNGSIGYNFTSNPKNYKIFAKSKSKALQNKWLQLIKDMNFYIIPKLFTFRTTLYREFNEVKLRPKSVGNIVIDTNYVKNFDWTRDYALRWDITSNLRFEYAANAQARLNEPQGLIDTKEKRDSVWKSFGDGGRMNTYTQRFDVSWQVPIQKIPLFNWVSANGRYSSSYTHTGSSLSLQYLGNTISNSNTIQGTGTLNFLTLYNNSKYLKKVNQSIKYQAPKAKPKALPTQNSENDKDKDKDKNKDKPKSEKEAQKQATQDSLKNVRKEKSMTVLNGFVRVLMLIRNASITYNETNGTSLPGYMLEPDLFGINFKTNSPGFLFVFGGQKDIRYKAVEGGWLTKDTMLNVAYQQTKNQNLSLRATLEPLKNFRIDITATRNLTEYYTEYFRANAAGEFESYSPMRSGVFSMTYMGLGTLFVRENKSETNSNFENFKAYRLEIAKRFAAENGVTAIDEETGYPDGYGETSQDVLRAAFVAAYTKQDPSKVWIKDAFPRIPLPNWRLNYNGLTKIKGMNKIFQNFSILHAYTSTYTVGNYATNLNYVEDGGVRNTMGDFVPRYDLSAITLVDQLSPLIGFDMTMKNGYMLKVEYKRTRNVSLSFANNQITEIGSNEFVFSTGYRFKDLKLGLTFGGVKRQIVSDLNLSLGVAVKDNKTVLRKIVEDVNQVSAGTMVITINVSADYQISQRIGLRFFYDHTINKPYISSSYNNMNLNTGISVTLMLSQ